jgi:hypothetical protein
MSMNSIAIFNRDPGPGGHAASSPASVLAIEPDAEQARVLTKVLTGRINGKLSTVDTTEEALKALVDSIPDLVLVSPLLSPRTEEQLMAHLRALGVDAQHLQILSIPRFGEADAGASGGKKRSLKLQSFGKQADASAPVCDPVAFANEVSAYLDRASDARHADPEQRAAEPSGGVRMEHLEQLLERMRSDSVESPSDDSSSPQEAAVAAPVEAIPGPDVMPMPTVHEPSGSALHDAASRLPRFLTLDDQISPTLRTLLDEADGCLKMSFFTGGGACAGRALDLLMSEQGISGGDRAHAIQEIGKKHPAVADSFLRVLSLAMADPGGTWDAARLTLAVVIMKAIAYEIYVLGPERTERATYVIGLLERFNSVSKGAA